MLPNPCSPPCWEEEQQSGFSQTADLDERRFDPVKSIPVVRMNLPALHALANVDANAGQNLTLHAVVSEVSADPFPTSPPGFKVIENKKKTSSNGARSILVSGDVRNLLKENQSPSQIHPTKNINNSTTAIGPFGSHNSWHFRSDIATTPGLIEDTIQDNPIEEEYIQIQEASSDERLDGLLNSLKQEARRKDSLRKEVTVEAKFQRANQEQNDKENEARWAAFMERKKVEHDGKRAAKLNNGTGSRETSSEAEKPWVAIELEVLESFPQLAPGAIIGITRTEDSDHVERDPKQYVNNVEVAVRPIPVIKFENDSDSFFIHGSSEAIEDSEMKAGPGNSLPIGDHESSAWDTSPGTPEFHDKNNTFHSLHGNVTGALFPDRESIGSAQSQSEEVASETEVQCSRELEQEVENHHNPTSSPIKIESSDSDHQIKLETIPEESSSWSHSYNSTQEQSYKQDHDGVSSYYFGREDSIEDTTAPGQGDDRCNTGAFLNKSTACEEDVISTEQLLSEAQSTLEGTWDLNACSNLRIDIQRASTEQDVEQSAAMIDNLKPNTCLVDLPILHWSSQHYEHFPKVEICDDGLDEDGIVSKTGAPRPWNIVHPSLEQSTQHKQSRDTSRTEKKPIQIKLESELANGDVETETTTNLEIECPTLTSPATPKQSAQCIWFPESDAGIETSEALKITHKAIAPQNVNPAIVALIADQDKLINLLQTEARDCEDVEDQLTITSIRVKRVGALQPSSDKLSAAAMKLIEHQGNLIMLYRIENPDADDVEMEIDLIAVYKKKCNSLLRSATAERIPAASNPSAAKPILRELLVCNQAVIEVEDSEMPSIPVSQSSEGNAAFTALAKKNGGECPSGQRFSEDNKLTSSPIYLEQNNLYVAFDLRPEINPDYSDDEPERQAKEEVSIEVRDNCNGSSRPSSFYRTSSSQSKSEQMDQGC